MSYNPAVRDIEGFDYRGVQLRLWARTIQGKHCKGICENPNDIRFRKPFPNCYDNYYYCGACGICVSKSIGEPKCPCCRNKLRQQPRNSKYRNNDLK